MDLLLQFSEKELEEFLEPPVDQTDQDKSDRTNTGGTQQSNVLHQLQTQTQTSTVSEASKVSTASLHSSQKHRYRWPAKWHHLAHIHILERAMWPVMCLHPSTADTTGGTLPEDIFQNTSPRSSKVFAFRNLDR